MDLGRPDTPAEPPAPAVSVHDRGWIPGPPEDVYRVIASLATYGSWWPGVRVEEEDTAERWVSLSFPPLGRLRAFAAGARPGVGVVLQLRGDVDGVLEWFLEQFKDGTLANVFLRLASRPRRWRRREIAYRSTVRNGLVVLRQIFEDRATAARRPAACEGGR